VQHCKHVDGVMIGREAYKNPYFLSEVLFNELCDLFIFQVDSVFYGETTPVISRQEVAEKMLEYADSLHDSMMNDM